MDGRMREHVQYVFLNERFQVWMIVCCNVVSSSLPLERQELLRTRKNFLHTRIFIIVALPAELCGSIIFSRLCLQKSLKNVQFCDNTIGVWEIYRA